MGMARRLADLVPAALLVAMAALAGGCRPVTPPSPFSSSHVMVFELQPSGRITPYSYYLRDRELEPVPPHEVRAVMARQASEPPVREGYVAVRGHDRWGTVIFTTMVKVVLMGHTLCCPHQDFRIESPVLSVVIPARAHSVSFEGWTPAMRARYSIAEVIAAHRKHSAAE
jgi:hypothetical protein